MTVQAGSMTLAQWAMLSNNPLVEAVSMSLVDAGSVMARDIPFANNETLYVNGVRFDGNLPAVNWATLNAEGTTVSTMPTPFQEQAYILRNQIDIDEFMIRDKNAIRDPRATQLEFYLKGVAFDFNNRFIRNDHVTGNANAPVGLRYRINNGNTFGVRTENAINASALDLSPAGLTSTPTNANTFLELLDQALFSVNAPYGDPNVVIYCNEVFLRRINRAIRGLGTQGGFNESMDMFDRVVTTYKTCPIRDVGRQADQTTLIITNTETAAGAEGAGTATSLYIVNYNDGFFGGWQFGPLEAKDLGQLNTGAQFRTYVSWAGGFVNYSNRSLARIYNIKIQ